MRARLGELQRRNEELEAAHGARFGWSGSIRAIAAVLLATLGALLVTLSVPTIWGRNLVLNTDRYVQTLEPLAADPGIQQAVVRAVAQQFTSRVDLAGAVEQALPPRAADLLSGPVQSAATGLVTTVTTKFVQSDAFVNLWSTVNRASHAALVGILTGERPKNAALTVKDGMLYLDLAPIVGAVKQRLVAAGLTIAQDVPVTGPTIQLLQLKGLDKAQSAVRNLNRVAVLLPLAGLACMVGAVLASRRRRREVIICALAAAGGMVVLAIGLLIGRQIYLDKLPLKYLSADDAGRIFDTMVRFLRDGLRTVFVVALLISAIAWLTGSSRQARSTRRGVASAARSLTAAGANWRYAGVLARNRRTVSVVLVAIAALILVLWTNPGVVTVLLIAAATAAVVVLVYTFPQPTTDNSATRRPS
jgi:hypothetical protein